MYDVLGIKKYFVVILVILLLGFFMGTVLGQTGKIAGRVTDAKTGDPLVGANIVIQGMTMGASTDQDGFFFILNIAPGDYSVTSSYMGYQTVTQENVRVNLGKTASVDFALNSTVLQGESVTIVAEREVIKRDLTASEQMISTEQIERSWVRSLPEALETQPGMFRGHVRGGSLVETVYMMDNVSLNSGLLSDNYTGINTSTVEEISLLTGGYNAEYGSAQSGIINVVTKESSTGIHGTALVRMRPAGKYHFGRNMYSKDNYDWTYYNLDYWGDESLNPASEFFGQDSFALLAQWQAEITPNETLRDYAKRPEYETEVTVFGPVSKDLNFLVSGRYKRAVAPYPQVIKYNPEYNFQGKLNYKLTSAIKLTFSGLVGGYETASVPPSNFNTTESAQEAAWYGYMQVNDPYTSIKYLQKGAYGQWPELRKVSNFALKLNHVLSQQTFYELNLSYLYDDVDKSDRDNVVPDDKWAFDDDVFGMTGYFQTEGYFHNWDKFNSKVYSAQGDLTSQLDNHHLIKAGFLAKTYDFSYEHAMRASEGGERWNLMNTFDGTPYEGAVYAQDKMEFAGLIVNAGVRFDFFNQNRDAAKNMFDPIAFQETTPGNVTPGLPGKPELEATKLQTAVSPRIGVSHPITTTTVLHFVYGHFQQRPSWNKMFGFPYINYDTTGVNYNNPFAQQETYMDQWMGFYGNPKMGYERTIQYEIGIDNEIANLIRLDVTGYYKDGNRQTVFREGSVNDPRWDEPGTWTWLYNATNQYNIAMMVSNTAFVDVRGVEIQIDTHLKNPVNFSLNYDLSYATGGVAGYTNLYELESGINTPQGFGQLKKAWNSNHKVKANMFVNFHRGYGPMFLGFKPLSDLLANLYFEYFSGQQYTYHGPGDTSTEPNNQRWEGHYRWNLKIAKGFTVMNTRPEISLEVRNLFNNKDLNMLYGDDLINYKEKGELPKHWYSGEPNEWGWYNIWTNPPREVYLQFKIDF